MLFFKRVATMLALFATLYLVVSVVITAVGGGIRSAQMAVREGEVSVSFNRSYARGLRARAEFRREHGTLANQIAMGVAAVGAVGLTFSGALRWCRRAPLPPPLPPATS